MEKKKNFKSNGKSITIPLNYKGYEVRANISRTYDPQEFNVTYEMGCKGYTHTDRIEGDTFTIHSEKDSNWDTYRFTMEKFAEGYFKPFIDRYEFEMTAMNRGIELLEAERGVVDAV